VSLLALAQPSEAKIVYTRTHRVIGDGGSFGLDLNHDGIVDLTFQNKHYSSCTDDGGICFYTERLTAKMAPGNQVVYNSSGAAAMKPGVQIGRKRAFAGGLEMMVTIGNYRASGGNWINVKNRYLGVKFKIKGHIHYGWARLSVQARRNPEITATLTGYAYETIPNKSIIAGKTKGPDEVSNVEHPNPMSLTASTPEPATLGALAMGAPALSIWRREEAASAGQ
jgi:hypothetical protein